MDTAITVGVLLAFGLLALTLHREFARRVRTERDLRASEQRGRELAHELRDARHFGRQIADTTPDIVYVFDLVERRNVYINQAVGPVLGYTADEIQRLGPDLLPTLLHPDDAAHQAANVERLRQSADGTVAEFEYRMRHADGRWRWLASRETVFARDPDGSPRRILGTAQDVTERREAEERLRLEQHKLEARVRTRTAELARANEALRTEVAERARAEARFRQLADAMPQIVWTARPDGTKEYFNRRWFEFTGLPEGDTEGWESILHPDDRANGRDVWAEAVRTGEPYHIEYRFQDRAGGGYRWHLTRALPVRDESGRIAKWFGTCTDIHDQKEAARALRRAHDELDLRVRERTAELTSAYEKLRREVAERRHADEKFRILFEHSSDAHVLFHEQDGIIDCNPAAAVMLRRADKAEVLSQHPAALAPEFQPDGRPSRAKGVEMDAVARRDGCHRFDWWFRRSDGEVFPCEVTLTPVTLGERSLLLGVWHDLTERKRAEDALRRAKEAAESANRAKSDFLANVSHEVRTPLNGILGLAELALGEELPPAQHERLRLIRESGQTLLVLINDLLDFAKIEAGKLDLDPVPFDLYEELGSTVKALAGSAHRKGLELACQIAPDVPAVLVGDPDRLRQVLVNLLGNAVKFTERGGVALRVSVSMGSEQTRRQGDNPVSARRVAAHHGCAEVDGISPAGPGLAVSLSFEVRDTGVGIPPEKLQRIFAPFEQADTSTTRQYGGTGLGLTIVDRLVRLLGGQVEVESEPGVGSTFRFRARFGVPTAPAPAPRAPRLDDLAVLVIDDNDISRTAVLEMLGQWRMRPAGAASPAEAWAALTKARADGERFDLLLLDEDLAGEDGVRLAIRLRAEGAFAGPVVLMRRAVIARHGPAAGDRDDEAARIAARLDKPFTPSDLLDTIAEAMRLSAYPPGLVVPEAIPVPVSPQRPLRILLVEDNPINQIVARDILQRAGHHVRVAVNGREGVAAFQRDGADLILMDLQMPEMDGFQATAAIRAREAGTGRRTPIVAMTARAMKGDEEECLAAGMDAYLTKPIEARSLYATIEKCLERGAWSVERETQDDSSRSTLPAARSTLFDAEALRADLGGNRQLLRMLADQMEADAPEMLGAIRRAIEGADPAGLARTAHKLAGAVSVFRAPDLLGLARQLETMGRDGILEGVAEPLRELEAAVPRLIAAVQAAAIVDGDGAAEPSALAQTR